MGKRRLLIALGDVEGLWSLTYRAHRMSLIRRRLRQGRWHVLCCQRPSLRLSATSSRAKGAARSRNTLDSPSITVAASPSFIKAPHNILVVMDPRSFQVYGAQLSGLTQEGGER